MRIFICYVDQLDTRQISKNRKMENEIYSIYRMKGASLVAQR